MGKLFPLFRPMLKESKNTDNGSIFGWNERVNKILKFSVLVIILNYVQYQFFYFIFNNSDTTKPVDKKGLAGKNLFKTM